MTGMIGVPGFAGEWGGGAVSPFARCVLAPNPGPMTLDGTNTWLVGAPDSRSVVLIDPGPADPAHWQQVADVLIESDRRVSQILLTHGHLDHSEGAVMFAELTSAPVRALDPRHQLGSEGLTHGEVVADAGLELAVVATPGHTSDSLSFVIEAASVLLTGDTVLGRGTTVVAHPDGQLGEYLDSLHRLADVVQDRELTQILPGHGPTLERPAEVIDAYLAHRRERLAQVAAAVDQLVAEGSDPASADFASQVVALVYADVPRSVWPAALLSVRAQLEFLSSHDA